MRNLILAACLVAIGCTPRTTQIHPLPPTPIVPAQPSPIVVYDFSAKWCAPCRKFAPRFESWSKRYARPGVTFKVIDIDVDRTTASYYKIKAIPTVLVVKSGVEVKRWEGEPHETDLATFLR